MVFSNNMEYDNDASQPIEGAFYASPSYYKPLFNYFREEEQFDLAMLLKAEEDGLENAILKDNNLTIIKHSPEFIINKNPESPTNRICTSLFSKQRLAFLLQHAIVYVNESDGLQKHIMRYPQLFATKAIEQKLSEGIRKGIIWHTQGSGKTALAYYNVRHLTDYFQKQSVIPKAISKNEYTQIAQDFCSFSRRKKGRIASYVTLFTTQEMDKKTSKLGIFFAGNRLSSTLLSTALIY